MRIPQPTDAATGALLRAGLFIVLAAAIIGGPATSFAAPSPAPDALRPAPVVAILLSPFLTYADLSPARTPALWSLAENGAIGSMNAVTADPGWPTVAGGALTLSAGRWAAASPDGPADAGSLARQQAANAGMLSRPVLGALGEALGSAGGLMLAVGNSDAGSRTAEPLRPAELVAADPLRGIDYMRTGSELLLADHSAPFGVRTDPARMSSAVASALVMIETSPNPGGLLVVDTGDLARAHLAASQPGWSVADKTRQHGAAVSALDAAAADLARQLPPDSLLLIVTPTTEKAYYEPPAFGPMIASGRGLSGLLTSASTHRPGLVTNLDVAPTVLAALGVPVPASMVGRSAASLPDKRPLAQSISALDRDNTAVGAVDKLRDLYFTPLFAWFAVICTCIAVLAAFWPAGWPRGVGRTLLLVVLSAAPAAWLALLLARNPASVGSAAVGLGVAWLVTFLLTMLVARLVSFEVALAALAGDTVLLIMADQWFAGPLQTGLFSYSVRAGWRYYGIGNEGSALAVGAALAGIALASDLSTRADWADRIRRYALPLVGVVLLLTAAAPFAGANAGVAVWGAVAFVVAWLRMNRIRLTARTVTLSVIAVIAAVGVLVSINLLGVGGDTHIGRFVVQLTQDGAGAWELVRRKALNNIGYLSQTPYAWLAMAIALGLALTWYVRPRPLARALQNYPGYSGALAGVIVGGAVALVTEDSGVVMPALMLLAGALPGLALALAPPPPVTDENGSASE